MRAGQTELAPAGFTEVKLEPAKSVPAPSKIVAHVRPSKICVEVAGVKISTDSSYPTENLAALLRELRS